MLEVNPPAGMLRMTKFVPDEFVDSRRLHQINNKPPTGGFLFMRCAPGTPRCLPKINPDNVK